MNQLIVVKKNVVDNMRVVLSTLQDGWSPLSVASYYGHDEIVRMLMKREANINSQDKVSAH